MRPDLADLLSTAEVVSLPLKTKFRGVTEREILIFEGPHGWAEWSPFLEYEDEEAAIWLQAGVEFAFEDLPKLHRDRIAVNATLPAVAADEITGALRDFGRFDVVKIKVAESGQELADDLERIAEVIELHPLVRIRLDANGALSLNEAIEFCEILDEAEVKIEYFEQPVATIADLAELRLALAKRDIKIKIAADESVRKVSDPLAVAHAGAADLLVLKVAPLGGIARATSIALEAGLPVNVSSAIDSSIGLAMGAHLAAALPELPFACGLGTGAMLVSDIVKNPVLPVDGFIEVARPEIDLARVAKLRVNDERKQWWLKRLERSYRLL